MQIDIIKLRKQILVIEKDYLRLLKNEGVKTKIKKKNKFSARDLISKISPIETIHSNSDFLSETFENQL